MMENLSILYGFPFGFYVHNIGPKLFNVPYILTLDYIALGYVSWIVSQAVLSRAAASRPLVYIAPLIAAFVFSAWDFCIDPIAGTIDQVFTYRNPGVWFGTPAINYFGWLLTTYLFYLPFSLYLSRIGRGRDRRVEPAKAWSVQPILVYLAAGFEIIIGNASGNSIDIRLANGKVWNSGDIRGALSLATLFTMVFISLLAIVNLYCAAWSDSDKTKAARVV